MTLPPTCTDCAQEMELGFIPDASYNTVMQSQWHPGTPADQRFLGLRLPTALGKGAPAIHYDPKQLLAIRAYRCAGCGLLRFYAPVADV